MHHQAALVTLLNILLIVYAMFLVGRARTRYGIHAPAITGDAAFERVFRAHQNTLEATIMFLPALWIASTWCNATYAAWLGYAWLAGRLWYLLAYASPTGSRAGGFYVGGIANGALLLWGLVCVVGQLLGRG